MGESRASRPLPPALAGLVANALDNLLAERRREGAAMARTMVEILAALEAQRRLVLARAPVAVAEHRQKLLTRVNEFLAGRAPALSDQDVIREVALYAERVDVHEELERIDAHVRQAAAILAGGGEIGRSLEFLFQELLREVNTIGSKVQDTEIAHAVVEMKGNVDKLRELGANLE